MAANHIPTDSIDQSNSQTGSIEDLKNADMIKISLFWSISRRGRTTQPIQKACNL